MLASRDFAAKDTNFTLVSAYELGDLGQTKKYLVEDDQAKHFLVETEDESPQDTTVGGVQNKMFHHTMPTVLPHKMRWMSGNFFYI